MNIGKDVGIAMEVKPFLILQLRPEDVASNDEFEAFLKAGGLTEEDTRRIRMEQEGVPSINLDDYSGVIVGGGPYCVSDANKSKEQARFEPECQELIGRVIDRDFPYLGACYGLGALATYLGGMVSKEKYGEGVGAVTIELADAAKDDALFAGLPQSFRAFGGHKEACQDVPPQAVLLASSQTCPVQVIRVKQNIYATQFHAELDSKGLALRIDTYRHAGYFRPEEADDLIAMSKRETVDIPEKIFRRFVERYSRTR